MSDFASWLTKSVKETFPTARHLKCFLHLKEKVKKAYRWNCPIYENYLDELGDCVSEKSLNDL